MATTPRYKNLAEIKAANAAGLLPEGAVLILDNDCSSMYGLETNILLYEGLVHEIREEALTLLGIPWDLC